MNLASITLVIGLSLPVDPGSIAFGFIFLALPVTGILIARRQPDNRIAWILLAIGAVIGVSSLAEPYVLQGVVLQPGSLPAAGAVAAVNNALWIPIFGLTGTFLLLLFPDGHLPSPRWRPVAWVSGITIGVLVLTFVFGPATLDNNRPWTIPSGSGRSPHFCWSCLPSFPCSRCACSRARCHSSCDSVAPTASKDFR